MMMIAEMIAISELKTQNKLPISKTSRFYIGLAVGLPVFSNISIILTHVQTVLSLQGKATSRNWLNRVYLAFSLFVSLIS